MPPVAARVAVIIPCHRDGPLVAEAVRSVQEDEPVELVVVDDASPDEATHAVLAELERDGVRVLRHEENRGTGRTRMTGLAATSAPFVYPLDGDDLALPGVLERMVDVLELMDTEVAACVGDIDEFGGRKLVRCVPATLDPYRVAYTNEYPVTALFRRTAVEAAGGWTPVFDGQVGYEDWNLWMALAERGERIVHVGTPGYRRRLHGGRLGSASLANHRQNYEAMRRAHPRLFADLSEHRRASDLPLPRKLLYPLLYGARPRVPLERRIKPWFDRLGLWTRSAKR
jgi:glycosyltransferase involved in cell wall biosynthesis